MSRSRRGVKGATRAVGVAALLCLVSAARPARADTLTFEAPPACGSAHAFAASVRQRTPLARFEDGSGGRAFKLRVAPATAGKPVRGALIVTDVDGATSHREVDGASCLEVVDALSLVVALTIDPNAEIAPSAQKEPVASDMHVETAPPLPVVAKPSVRRSPPARSSPPLLSSPSSRPSRWAARLTLEGILGLGAAPSPTAGLGLDVGVAREASAAPRLAAGLLGAHARVTVEKTLFSAAPPSADTLRALAALSVCPLAAQIGPVRSEMCAGVAGGVARFEGQGVANPSAKTRFWSHAEAALLARVPLGRVVFFAVRGSLELPFTRDELVFVRPEIFVHRASLMTGNVAAGFGLRL